MQKSKNSSKWFFRLGTASLGLMLLFFYILANRPDMELHFQRVVPSDSNSERIMRFMSSVTRWPQWFYSLNQVRIKPGKHSTEIEKGSIIVLDMDPHKGSKKRFQLTAEVTQYLPGRSLGLKILQDSSGRLTRLFDHLEWNIEIRDQGKGSLISGTVIAHTHHWRSRLFGQIAEKILLNQTFYPDLVKLAELKHPFSTDVPPPPGQAQAM